MNKIKNFFSVRKNVLIVVGAVFVIVAVLLSLTVAGVFNADYDYRSVGGGENSPFAQKLSASLDEIDKWKGQSISYIKTFADGRKEHIYINIVSGDKYNYQMLHRSVIEEADGTIVLREKALYKNEVLYTGADDEGWPYKTRNIITTGEFNDLVETYVGDYAERLSKIGADIIVRLYERKSGGSLFYMVKFNAMQAGEIIENANLLEIVAECVGNDTKKIIIRYNIEKGEAQDSEKSSVSIEFVHYDEDSVGDVPSVAEGCVKQGIVQNVEGVRYGVFF